MLLILNKTVSQAAFGCLLLIVQHLCELLDTMPRHWSPGTSHAPFTAHATDLREGFLPSCWFQEFPGGSNSTSKLAGLHADFRNIALARLFCRTTAIHKHSGRFYLCA